MSKHTWDYCADCGGSLDIGWECNRCGADWMPYAFPWWKQIWMIPLDRLQRSYRAGRKARGAK